MQQGGTLNALPVTIGVSRVELSRPTRYGNGSEFEMTAFYANGFPFPVTLAFRSGLAITVPPDTTQYRYGNDFVIQIKYRFSRAVIIDRHQVLNAISEDPSSEAAVLKKGFDQAQDSQFGAKNECSVDYVIDRKHFEMAGGAVFIDELDLTIARESNDRFVVHPFSPAGRQLRQAVASVIGQRFVYNIEINDPNGRFGDHWVNIAGKAYKVPAQSDPTRTEGVYVHSTFPDGEHRVGENFLCDKLDFEKAVTVLALFRTAAEARTLGNQAEARKRELEELQHAHKLEILDADSKLRAKDIELQQAKHAFEETSHRTKLELLHEQQKTKQLEETITRRDMELKSVFGVVEQLRKSAELDTKDYYERRSHERKDTSEIVKWIPAIATAVGLLIFKVATTGKS